MVKIGWRIRLVDGWQDLHKKSTVIAASGFAALYALGPVLIEVWNQMPQDLKDALPGGAARWISVAAFLLMIAFRYTKIEKKEPDHE